MTVKLFLLQKKIWDIDQIEFLANQNFDFKKSLKSILWNNFTKHWRLDTSL